MTGEWIKILWILVPLAAIIGGITYNIIRLRHRTDGGESGSGSQDVLLRETLAAQRAVAEQLSLIERRLSAIEKTLEDVPS